MLKKKIFVVIFLATVLPVSKNICNITKNKQQKFQKPVSNTLDFIQTYVTTNTEYHNFRKTEFKIKSQRQAAKKNIRFS